MDELSRIRREAVAKLCQAQADGRLSIEAFEERYALIADAETPAAVKAIVAAFEEESGGYEVVSAEPPSPPAADYPPPPPTRMAGILGSLVRAGNWNVPEEIDLLVILGEAKLDLREAAFAADTVVINLSLTLGSLELTVPPGTQVENDCELVLTSSDYKRLKKVRAEPNGLVVIIQGRSLIGDITIREKDFVVPRTLFQRMGLGS